LNRDKTSIKILSDFYARICIQLPQFKLKQLFRWAYYCEDVMRTGCPRALFWKDVLPCILRLLQHELRSENVDGEQRSGKEFHQMIVNGILSKEFPIEIITSIASMFR
jgi:hypothetical protein